MFRGSSIERSIMNGGHVVHEVVFLNKRFITFCTYMLALFTMSKVMLLQGPMFGKSLFANRTCKRLQEIKIRDSFIIMANKKRNNENISLQRLFSVVTFLPLSLRICNFKAVGVAYTLLQCWHFRSSIPHLPIFRWLSNRFFV